MARTRQIARLIEGSNEPFFLICLSSLLAPRRVRGLASVLRADSDPVEHPEGSEASHPPAQQEQASGSLSGVSASVSDLMAPEKRKTLLFEPAVVSQSTIDFYVSKGYFPEGVCHPPGLEVFPVPQTGEVVVFKDFFYHWVAHSDGSSSFEATGAIQREASPFHPERNSSIVQIFMGCKDVRRWSVR